MEVSYQYANAFKEFHQFGSARVIVCQSEFLDNPMKFPVMEAPLFLVQHYAKMSLMLSIAKSMIWQRNNNYANSKYFDLHKPTIARADYIAMELFHLARKYNYQKFYGAFPLLIECLKKMSPPRTSRFRSNYIKRINYLNYLLSYDITKSSSSEENSGAINAASRSVQKKRAFC